MERWMDTKFCQNQINNLTQNKQFKEKLTCFRPAFDTLTQVESQVCSQVCSLLE